MIDRQPVNINNISTNKRSLIGIIVGFFVSLPWLAWMYLGQQTLGTPQIPFELFEFLTRSLPGGIISLGIEWLIQFVSFIGLGQTSSSGKLIEIAGAYLLSLVILCLFGGLYAITLQKMKSAWSVRGVLAGLLLTSLMELQ